MMCALVAACGGSSGSVIVGAAGPWHEGFGAMNKRGIDLAAEQINASHLFGNRRFEVEERNDSGEGRRAAAIAAQFVADPRIAAVIGHVTSGAMVAAARVYDGHLAAIATTATSPALTGISRWTFRVISSDSMNGAAMARFASTRLGRKRAGILYENDAYGRGLTNAFRKAFDGEIVSIDPISAEFTNFEPYVTYLKRHGVDLVFVAGTEGTGMAILREGRRQSLAADFLGGDGWTGVVADTAASEGAYVGAPFTAEDPRPEAQKFVQAFEQKYGLVPDGNAALAYDATMLAARAVKGAGEDRRKVRDWLAGLRGGNAYLGASGPIQFGADGDPQGRAIVVTRVHHGRLLVESGGTVR
jgi:branched-chain amino acid transport system substrate-binding protein